MEGIREWISDNLRYILLGVALILVLVLAVIGVRTISSIAKGGSGKKAETEVQTETTVNTDVIVETENQNGSSSGTLVNNDEKVLTMMTSYYTARTNKDIETLKKLDPSIDEAQEQTNLENSYVESYSNIKTYSKEGPTEGSCIVYVCYDGKVKDIDTLVPSLTQFYLKSDESGAYYIADIAGDDTAKQFVEEMQKSAEVQSLIEAVDKNCEEAKASDPVLKDFMDKYGNSQTSDSDEETENNDSSELVALDSCNIRAEASTESDIIGGLYTGETVTKLGETDDGWTQIDYNGQTAYVKSELLGTADDAQAQADADYFAPGAAEEGTQAGDTTAE